MDEISIHLIIKGRVQGVWFRGWAVQQAQAYGIQGWVRNRIDKSVEAVFTGPSIKVNEMIARCQKGPPLARVDSVTETRIDYQVFIGFEKRPTT